MLHQDQPRYRRQMLVDGGAVLFRRISKPWGFEDLIFADANRYALKRITVYKGHRLSLQYHERKHESCCVVSGSGTIQLAEYVYKIGEGDVVVIPPGRIHRITADPTQDLVLIEASTPELDDVVRLEDDYGRAGQAG